MIALCLTLLLATSQEMERDCSASAGDSLEVTYADLGLEPGDVHTAFTDHPSDAALNAFLDFLSLVDAAFIVRTHSSFSGTAADIVGLNCRRAKASEHFVVVVCVKDECIKKP